MGCVHCTCQCCVIVWSEGNNSCSFLDLNFSFPPATLQVLLPYSTKKSKFKKLFIVLFFVFPSHVLNYLNFLRKEKQKYLHIFVILRIFFFFCCFILLLFPLSRWCPDFVFYSWWLWYELSDICMRGLIPSPTPCKMGNPFRSLDHKWALFLHLFELRRGLG